MSDDAEQKRRQLLILDDIIDKLFGSRLKTKPFDVLEKKLEKMETIVANLSDRDSLSRGEDQFSIWKSRLSMWWERFAEEKEKSHFSLNSFAEGTVAGKVPAATVPSSSSSSSGHFSTPQLSFPPSHNRPANVDNIFSDVFKRAWPGLYYPMKSSFDKLSQVRSRDDSIRIKALYNNIATCFDKLIYKRLIGDHQIHSTVIKMATDKLPQSMQSSFQLQNKKSLKALMTYLSDHLPNKMQTDTKGSEKDGDNEKLNLASTKVDVENVNSEKKAVSNKKIKTPLIIPKPPPPPPVSQTISSSNSSIAVISPVTSPEHKKTSLTQTKLIKKELKQSDQVELEEGELPEKDSFLASTVPQSTQRTNFNTNNTDNMKQTATTSKSDDTLNNICSQIDRQFFDLSLVHSETDIAGLNLLLRAVMNATVLIKPYDSQLRILLDRRIFHLTKCLMSTSWFWGVHASKQTGAFMSKFLQSKILEAKIASGRMIVQEDGKLVMSGQQQQPQQQQLLTKDSQTKKEDKFPKSQNNPSIGEMVRPPSESSTDSTTDPEMPSDILALNSFLTTCRQEVSDFKKEPKDNL